MTRSTRSENTPFGEFDFDLGRAVTNQLVEALDQLTPGQLDERWLSRLANRPGVYQLFVAESLVYIGKSKGTLASRLRRHHKTLSGRTNIDMNHVKFRCVYIHPNWAPSTHEDALLKHFHDQCPWNYSGFGSNDPGRERDTTTKPPEGFDRQYPIRDDWRCETIHRGEWGVLDLLRELKKSLPYLLRFKGGAPHGHPDFRGRKVTIPRNGMTAAEILTLTAKTLPGGWQATIFPSHMILYPESRPYEHGRIIWPPAQRD